MCSCHPSFFLLFLLSLWEREEIIFVDRSKCVRDNYAINHFLLLLFSLLFSDLQFPIDLSCVEKNVEKDHPFLQKDQLQALYRRLLVLNRSAAMRLDGQYNRNINVCRNFIFFRIFPLHSSTIQWDINLSHSLST
jgi:hypothetical protein